MSEQPDSPRRSGRRLLPTALLSLLSVLVLVVAYGLLHKPNGASAPRTAGAGSPAPATPAADPVVVSEASIKQDIAAGKPMVLLFMATGCTSCGAAAMSVTTGAQTVNQARTASNKVLLVGVDVASSDDPKALSGFVSDAQLASLPITWTIDADGSLAAQYQDQSLDETVGVADDVVRFHNAALVDAQQLRQQIEQLQ